MSSSSTSTLESPPEIPPEPPGADLPGPGGPAQADGQPRLDLTEFLDVATLQQIQEGFTALTRLVTTIRDSDGHPLVGTAEGEVQQGPTATEILDQLIIDQDLEGQDTLVAPITVKGHELGTISIGSPAPRTNHSPDLKKLYDLAAKWNLPADRLETLLAAALRACGPNKAAAAQFLSLMANSMARTCYDEYELRRRVEELSALYDISTLLVSARNLDEVLKNAARSAAQALNAKAASIRLLNETGNELVLKAVYNLSDAYLTKGPIVVKDSDLFRQTLDQGATYVQDMATDPRILYPQDARREGLVSVLNVAMVYKSKPIGVIRLYTESRRVFLPHEIEMLRAVGQLLATAIENARLDMEQIELQRTQRHLRLAADVQRRMLPESPPRVPPFDVAARYESCLELCGDFYDFITLESSLGIAVGDVVGKGVAASLLMASVRASLRAYAQDVYDLDEIISRVNTALVRDTLDNEFATLFYGVLDPQSMRLTYCNAGHEPPMLLRDGRITELDTGGMIVGVDDGQPYEKGLVQLLPGDLLLIFTDGLSEALNFQEKMFGRDRIRKALREAGDLDAARALNSVVWEMRRFVGLNRPVDDLTLVAVKVGSPTSSGGGIWGRARAQVKKPADNPEPHP